MQKFDGRSAVVTGGAQGIGAAVARALVDAGIRVLIGDLDDDEGKRLAESLGEHARYRHLDVTDAKDWRAALEESDEELGPLAILVNNAGIVDFHGVADEWPAQFRHVLDVNLYGPWLGMHSAAPILRRNGGGAIVNISSTAGLTGYSGLGGYVASKWGLRGLTKAAALDFAEDGIRVCSVHPGPIRTPMTAGLGEEIVTSQPIPRFGDPAEVAAMVRFVALEATYSTGSEFVVDGGATAGSVAISKGPNIR
ncbi:SDR family NAD(P)-dependent oxidoreductase [Antrihabitans sp. YC2-6]|uniref:SDR family NAD(P)-dependent oxidoreductase n=1 Tax=Antrihabitans sp. YC2-6 TaxID=2799498 RepID=UPI0018F3F72C|nr:SDR family oxidoreductase [Antrihabitans sp. YC2-6]MBJ8346975.1 SDR family oxidoreductase [Antrihabitans sp. YC2-6]